MKYPFTSPVKRSVSLLIGAFFAITVMTSPILVWAAPEPPSTPDDIKSFVTNTAWYDPSAQGNCVLNGMSMRGTSEFLQGSPITLNYPTITDDIKFAAAMENFIQLNTPNSPWLEIPDLGARLVQEGRLRDVNPMLIVVIGRHETQLGTIADSSAAYKNSFGNKGANPPGSPETDYKIYPSFEASLFGDGSFTEAVQHRLSGIHPSYKDVTNMYEYLSVHVSGQIIYPNDNKASYDTTTKTVVDIDGENGYAGPLQYFKNAITWIGQMTGLEISGIPVPGGENGCGGCITQLNGITISFPLEPCTKRSYTNLPCNKRHDNERDDRVRYTDRLGNSALILTCHHDGSPAFDLYFEPHEEMGGKKVYAITDGEIIHRSNFYSGVDGCYNIQFYSTTQNRYYWMGHLQNADKYVNAGQTVKAGDVIAEVGNMELKRLGCSPGPPHLHIDRGCVNTNGTADPQDDLPQQAGYDNCRDPAFLEELKTVWEGLPPDPDERGVQ